LTTADLYDGIHPTEAAHAKIAQKFLEGIRAALGAPLRPGGHGQSGPRGVHADLVHGPVNR
jgi:hypothetical protein